MNIDLGRKLGCVSSNRLVQNNYRIRNVKQKKQPALAEKFKVMKFFVNARSDAAGALMNTPKFGNSNATPELSGPPTVAQVKKFSGKPLQETPLKFSGELLKCPIDSSNTKRATGKFHSPEKGNAERKTKPYNHPLPVDFRIRKSSSKVQAKAVKVPHIEVRENGMFLPLYRQANHGREMPPLRESQQRLRARIAEKASIYMHVRPNHQGLDAPFKELQNFLWKNRDNPLFTLCVHQ